MESVDLRSAIRKADAVLPAFARAGQRGDTLKRVARRGRCRLLFRLGVQHITDPSTAPSTVYHLGLLSGRSPGAPSVLQARSVMSPLRDRWTRGQHLLTPTREKTPLLKCVKRVQ